MSDDSPQLNRPPSLFENMDFSFLSDSSPKLVEIPSSTEPPDPEQHPKFRDLTLPMRNMGVVDFDNYARTQVYKNLWAYEYMVHMRRLHAQYRRERRRRLIAVSARERTWAHLFAERTKEAQQASARLNYQRKSKANPKLEFALAQYLDLLKDTLVRMRHVQAMYTKHGARAAAVKAYNKDREAAGKSPVTNEGEYWEDWVTPSARKKITQLFNEAMADRAVHARWSQPFTKERPKKERQPRTRETDPKWDDPDPEE